MFVWDWIVNIFQYFGYFRTAKLVIIGLDNAGKSTLLHLLKTGRLVQFPPTDQARCEELTMGGLTIQAYDLGGHVTARRVWRDYFPAVDGVVFIVDAACQERLMEAKQEIHGLLQDDLISDIPILILGNKTDKTEAFGYEEMVMHLDIQGSLIEQVASSGYTVEQDRPADKPKRTGKCQLFMCSLRMKQGYGDAFRWLSQVVK